MALCLFVKGFVMMYALHGFLGLSRDWASLLPHAQAVSLFDIAQPSETIGPWQWAEQFNKRVSIDSSRPNFLVAYSLGGRLAMHALLSNPGLWQGAILISSNPGFEAQVKPARLRDDIIWANRFITESWDSLIQAWNQQQIFGGFSGLQRKESDFSRKLLSDTLRYWSLGQQDLLTPQLQELDLPILWISGENDVTYTTRAKQMLFSHPKSRVWVAPNAAHRVPWQQPVKFLNQMQQFLGEL